jgi:hypothetical protein
MYSGLSNTTIYQIPPFIHHLFIVDFPWFPMVTTSNTQTILLHQCLSGPPLDRCKSRGQRCFLWIETSCSNPLHVGNLNVKWAWPWRFPKMGVPKLSIICRWILPYNLINQPF